MPPPVDSFLNEIFSSLIVAVTTAIITVRLSLRRFANEKWWERKADTYTRIMEALHRMKAYCDGMFANDTSSEMISEEKKADLFRGWQQSIADLQRSMDMGSFIVSKAANQVLMALIHKLNELNYTETEGYPWERFSQQSQVISNTLAAIRTIAKKDLNVK